MTTKSGKKSTDGKRRGKVASLAAALAGIEDLEVVPPAEANALERRFTELAGAHLRLVAEHLDFSPEEAPNVWEGLASSVEIYLKGPTAPSVFDGDLDDSAALRRAHWPVHMLAGHIPGTGKRLFIGKWELLMDAWNQHVREFGFESIDWWGKQHPTRRNPWIALRRDLVQRLREWGLERSLTAFCYGAFHQESRELVYWLQKGGRNGCRGEIPKYYGDGTGVVVLKNRVAKMEPSGNGFELTKPTLLSVVLQPPYPFGLCAQCDRPYVQKALGKLRRYCSTRCKAAGIPSAAKARLYAREYRQRRMARDVEIATKATQGAPEDQWYKLVARCLPKRRRAEHLRIIKLIKGEGPRRKRRTKGER